MVCYLFGAKPLTKTMKTFSNLDRQQQNLMNFESKYKNKKSAK